MYSDVELADLLGLHRKRSKTVEDMLVAVKTIGPKAKRLEMRGDQAAAGDLLALLDSRLAALSGSPTKILVPNKHPRLAVLSGSRVSLDTAVGLNPP